MARAELRRLYEAGHFSAHTLVKEESQDGWIPIQQACFSPSSFASTQDDGDEYEVDLKDGLYKPMKPALLSKQTLKSIGSTFKDNNLMRSLAGGKRRISLTENPLDLSPSTLVPVVPLPEPAARSTQSSSFSLGPSASSVAVPPPSLWRSASTPTSGGVTKRTLKALTSLGSSSNTEKSPRGHHSTELTDEEDVGDVLSSVRSLSLALNQVGGNFREIDSPSQVCEGDVPKLMRQALEQVDHLEASMKKTPSPAKRVVSNPSELELENAALKERLSNIQNFIKTRHPALQADVDALALGALPTHIDTPSVPILPLEVDSPLLRERVARHEAALDELRQALKTCVKSGLAFVAQLQQPVEQKRTHLALDLARSGNEQLVLVSQVLLGMRDGRDRLMARLENDFLLPLASFANADLKRANHVSADLERRREAFETIEARLMGHRRLGKHTGKPVEMESPDKLSIDYINAEANYELARLQLIKVLNELMVDERVEINKCCLAAAMAFNNFYLSGAAEASRLLAQTRAWSDSLSEIVRNKELWERNWQVRGEESHVLTARQTKMTEVETRRQRFSPPTRWSSTRFPDLLFEGWLFKRSSNVIKDWKKRYFQLWKDRFVYFRAGKEEHVVPLLLCSVRDAAKAGLGVFEVVSNSRIVALQASSEEEKDAWMQAIRKAVEGHIGQSMGTEDVLVHTNVEGGDSDGEEEPIVEQVSWAHASPLTSTQDEANSRCADCQLGPVAWVSLNLGVLLCISCSGVHRSLGSHVSKVRSLHLDSLGSAQVLMLRRLGNSVANKVWEELPVPTGHRLKEGFVVQKYVQRAYVDLSQPVVLVDLFKAAATDDVGKVLWFVAHGMALDSRGSALETALHCAAQAGHAASVELLLLNGARMDLEDAQGRTPLDVAKGAALLVLRTWEDTAKGKKVLATELV